MCSFYLKKTARMKVAAFVGGVNIVHLKSGVMGGSGRGEWVLDDVNHCAAGKLEPIQVIPVDHLGNLSHTEDVLIPLQSCFLVSDVVGDVIDILQSDFICEHYALQVFVSFSKAKFTPTIISREDQKRNTVFVLVLRT